MKLSALEQAIYGAAFAQRFDEERKASEVAAIAETHGPEERKEEAIQTERWQGCCERAIEYAEAVVDAHRRVKATRQRR